MDIFLTNNLTNKKEQFVPKNNQNIGMYVCGPTVYDDPHIGNARPLVIFDVLFRLLKNTFSKVTYVRNITDIDDKIIKSSQEQKISVKELTENLPAREEIVVSICTNLIENSRKFFNQGFDHFKRIWNASDCYLGSNIVIKSGTSEKLGKSLGVNNQANLIIETDLGQELISSGEIYFDLKIAKGLCGKEQKVIKVPNTSVFKKVAPMLVSRGISRIVSADQLIAL